MNEDPSKRRPRGGGDPLDDWLALHEAPLPSEDFTERVLRAWSAEAELVPPGRPAERRGVPSWLTFATALAALWFATFQLLPGPPEFASEGGREAVTSRPPRDTPPSPPEATRPSPRVVTGAIGTAGFAPAAIVSSWIDPAPAAPVERFDDLRPEELSWR